MRASPHRSKPEPTIALINIVFLMLVFFMVAGTLAPPMDPDVTLVNTRELDGKEPSNALVILEDGDLRFRGNSIADPSGYLAQLQDPTIARIMPDRNAPARAVLSLARQLKQAGVEKVLIVTEKALQ